MPQRDRNRFPNKEGSDLALYATSPLFRVPTPDGPSRRFCCAFKQRAVGKHGHIQRGDGGQHLQRHTQAAAVHRSQPARCRLHAHRQHQAESPDHQPEVPVHQYVPVYHLRRHRCYQVHDSQLDEYQYNLDMDDQLVLPEITKNLIDTLVSQGRISFADIVEGKGSGACILLGGPPGTGKTLTAEIFAESTERPLLSVQAAQLGVNPDTVEKELNLILQRGARFNAVILLDEADIDIRERGTNLAQNAIVAAFLRTLETHNATLFLTTNRTNNVDDAIASRCLARIDYDMPTNDEQKPIWKILNHINQSGLSDHDIDTIVERHHQFSGRDIKQILKLASLWSSSKQTPVTTESIDFVAAFIPTRPFQIKNHPPQNETK